ncbi:MAG TPA: PASTA domain-containing protein, partial [Polyangiaceae bacterium]|nr:PASTA domain-containing protein [Polyangiaceae bacterium]
SLEPEPAVASDDPKPRGISVPDLAGYTLPFAARKLAALGLFADATSEVVSDPARDGCIVRQLPRAGESVAPAAMIRVFVGKSGAS